MHRHARSSPPPCRARGCRSGYSARRGSPASNTPSPLVSVLFDPVRSAEPPIVSGTAALTTSSTSSEDLRVATFAAASDCAFGRPSSAPASFFGSVAGHDPRRTPPAWPPESLPSRASHAVPRRRPAAPIFAPLADDRRPAPRTADTASRRSRGPWRSPRRRAASRAPPWCPAWSARRSRYASGSRSSPAGSGRPSPRQRPVDVVRVMPVALVHRPARRPRTAPSGR